MQNPHEPAKPNYPVESVDRALALLLLLRDRKSMSVSEASRAVGVAPSTAHRLLAALQYRGFVAQDPLTKAYGPGPVLLELGLSVVRGLDIRAQARPVMERLVREVGETAHLAILRGSDILFIESIESDKALRVANRAGMTLPAHATAAGKALLAGLSAAELTALYPVDNLPHSRPRAHTTRAALEQELASVRARGYATNFDESEPDVSAVAAAITDRAGRVRAALTVSAPLSRLDEAQVTRIAEAVLRAAGEIGVGLS
jgi:IclR family acetate operon transcriptional repressor